MINLKQIKPNLTVVNIGALTLYFSYETIVAFEEGTKTTPTLTICENVWSGTTGRHLNEINSDKSIRVTGDVFKAKLKKLALI